jgi:hypothetical protein
MVATMGGAALVLAVAILGAAPAAADGPRVRAVYLVPEDRAPVRAYEKALGRAIEDLRSWFANQMGGPTFALHDPVVEVVPTPHAAAWYAGTPSDPDPALWFFRNVTHEAFALTGAGFLDPDNVWLLYIDADPGCGQLTGGTSHVALLAANDLRGLAGRAPVPICAGETPGHPPVSRWIGGLGHELGHALGLPHPPGCEPLTPACPAWALMYFGYLRYPNTFLLPADVASLAASPFLAADPACAPSALSATALSFDGGRVVATVDVTAPRSCAWVAASHDRWIAITGKTGRSGNGRVRFALTPNAAPTPRAGTLVIAGQRLSITQAPLAGAPAEITVDIDIEPREASTPTMDWSGRGRITVAVLSTPSFSAAADVDPASLSFGPTGVELAAVRCRERDADGDALADLVCVFQNGQSAFVLGDFLGVLTGTTRGGVPLRGLALVRIGP